MPDPQNLAQARALRDSLLANKGKSRGDLNGLSKEDWKQQMHDVQAQIKELEPRRVGPNEQEYPPGS